MSAFEQRMRVNRLPCLWSSEPVIVGIRLLRWRCLLLADCVAKLRSRRLAILNSEGQRRGCQFLDELREFSQHGGRIDRDCAADRYDRSGSAFGSFVM